MPTMKLQRRTIALPPVEKPIMFWDSDLASFGFAGISPTTARNLSRSCALGCAILLSQCTRSAAQPQRPPRACVVRSLDLLFANARPPTLRPHLPQQRLLPWCRRNLRCVANVAVPL